jgi:hypothetical protein
MTLLLGARRELEAMRTASPSGGRYVNLEKTLSV